MIFIEVALVAVGALFIPLLKKLPITPHDYFQDPYMEHQVGLPSLRYIHLFEPVASQRAGLELAIVLDLQDRIR